MPSALQAEPGVAPPQQPDRAWTHHAAVAALAALSLVPAALTAYLAFQDGGYLPGPVGLAAAELALLLALVLAVRRRPFSGLGLPAVLAGVAIAAFAAWTYASSDRSGSEIRAVIEYDRVLLYGLAFTLFAVIGFSTRRVRWMVWGMAAVIVGVCGAALAVHTLPAEFSYTQEVHPERLAFPLGYWNALGVFAALGIVLCGHLASDAREPAPIRVVAAAALPMLATTLYFTFSRGGTWVAVGAVVVYVLVGRPRGILFAALATLPPTAFALTQANPPGALTGSDRTSPEAVATGHRILFAVVVSMAAAAILRAAFLPLDRRVRQIEVAPGLRRRLLAAGAAAGLTIAVIASLAANIPDLVSDKYREFTARDDGVGSYAGSSRFLDAGSNGRREHWDVALAAYRSDRLHGTGAGTYALEWDRRRPDLGEIQDAHSLYYEVLGELGWPGLAMLGVAILLILGGFAARARGPDRALFAALLAAGLAWAVHAGFDWDWEMPAVTLGLFALGGATLARRARDAGNPRPALSVVARLAAVAACALLAVIPIRMALSSARVDDSLARVHSDDCRAAVRSARDALSAYERPIAHQVIAFCRLRQGRPAAAATSMTAAVRLDPRNSELRYGRAVSRGLAGLDPRADAARALRLNPLDRAAQELVENLRAAPGRWRHAVSRSSLHEPGPPTP